MAGAGHHVGQMGLVIVKQRDWLLQLSPLSVAGSSSPPVTSGQSRIVRSYSQ
jgi:hypothetical protein